MASDDPPWEKWAKELAEVPPLPAPTDVEIVAQAVWCALAFRRFLSREEDFAWRPFSMFGFRTYLRTGDDVDCVDVLRFVAFAGEA